MSKLPAILAALVEGAALGLAFYFGLWFTVRKGLRSNYPALLFLTSLVLRAAMAVVGFYYITHGDWGLLAASLAGFLFARSCAFRFARGTVEKASRVDLGGRP